MRILATPPLFLEYEDVLKRPEQLAASQLSRADVDVAWAALIEPVEAHLLCRPQLPDPDAGRGETALSESRVQQAAPSKRPPFWADPRDLPIPGLRCTCCGLGRWWRERVSPKGWR
jgi:hypothetical protein